MVVTDICDPNFNGRRYWADSRSWPPEACESVKVEDMHRVDEECLPFQGRPPVTVALAGATDRRAVSVSAPVAGPVILTGPTAGVRLKRGLGRRSPLRFGCFPVQFATSRGLLAVRSNVAMHSNGRFPLGSLSEKEGQGGSLLQV